MRSWFHRLPERWRSLSTRRRRWVLALGVVLGVLFVARLLLPTWAKRLINDRLATIDPYRGHVGNVDLALWRGAYGVSDVSLSLHQPGSAQHDPLLTIESIDISLSWRHVFRGELVGAITVIRPELIVTPELGKRDEEPSEGEEPAKSAPESWQDQLRHLSLLRFDRIVVQDGVISYQDDAHDVAKIPLATVQIEVTGLAVGTRAANRDATLTCTGRTIGSGTLTVNGQLDPLAEQPTFTVQAHRW